MHRYLKSAVVTLFAGLLIAGPALADVIDQIHSRGELIVGVKADYKPYGYINENGNIVGMEPDLAKHVADALGVKLKLVPVQASNRMQFLQQGRIDLMIATMTDRPDRRKVVWVVDPDYYSSGTNVLALKKAKLTHWSDLKGLPVCGIQGAFYNRKTQQKFGAKIVAFKGTAEALTALKQGRCVAFVYDDSFITSKLNDPAWSNYDMPLKTIDEEPWGLAVKHGQKRFHAVMSELIKRWFKTGLIQKLETKYHIKQNSYVEKMHQKYKDYQPKPLKKILAGS